jgi:nitrogen fixation protein FixH
MLKSPKAQDRIVPLLVIGFIVSFSVVILAMVTVAFKTFTGTVAEKSHGNEMEFSKVYSASLKQPDKDVLAEVVIRQDKAYINVKTSLPYRIDAKIVRPVGHDFDSMLEVHDAETRQHHIANLPHELVRGMWEVRFRVITDDGRTYSFSKRFVRQ